MKRKESDYAKREITLEILIYLYYLFNSNWHRDAYLCV